MLTRSWRHLADVLYILVGTQEFAYIVGVVRGCVVLFTLKRATVCLSGRSVPDEMACSQRTYLCLCVRPRYDDVRQKVFMH